MQEKKRFVFAVCVMLILGLAGVSSGKDERAPEASAGPHAGPPPTEAPTGFDNQTNGLTTQEVFVTDREDFEEVESPADGLGPVFNARSCAECHAVPVVGGSSQVSVLRAGHWNGRQFTDHPGGTLIHDRAIDAAIQEFVVDGYNVRAFRMSTSVLGAGFIEAIPSETLENIAREQRSRGRGREREHESGRERGQIAGQLIEVPVLEAGGARRAGRFGAKNQHASLVSFAADAYFNEMGITNPLFPTENTSLGHSVAAFDTVADPEDDGHGVGLLARFIRATKAPSRHEALAASPEAQAGERLFKEIGCGICHVSTMVTAMPGTVINGGTFTVPEALGNKIIHPYSDFLLHDVGTGDGIVQNGGVETRNKVRTIPLWGLRTRVRLMHDGLSMTRSDAILRHKGEASEVIRQYEALSDIGKEQVLTFLDSL